MDLDLSDDSDGLHAPLHRNPVLFDVHESEGPSQRAPAIDMPRAVQGTRERDEEDMWAEIG